MNTLRRWVTLMTHHPWRRLAVIVGFSALLVLALGVAALTGVRTASANTNSCPNSNGIGNLKTSNLVGASFSISTVTNPNDTATYVFDSFVNTNPTNGVPGLQDYCVYPGTQPGSITPQAVGADSSAWVDPPAFDNFSFARPDGNPSNINLDGTTGTTMGTATWAGAAPTTQTIVLHINDAAECDALYGGNPGTCFVKPGTVAHAKDLTVSKTATPSFDRTFTWSITKNVDKTEIDIANGNSATFNYMVIVSHGAAEDSNWQVNGTITVNNPNGFDVNGVNVTDAVDNGGTCTVTNGTNVTVPANGSVQPSYTCTYASAPSPSSGTNTATATWDSALYNTPDSSASGSASFTFDDGSAGNPTETDNCVTVTDTLGGTLGTVCVGGANPKTFTYSNTVSGNAGTCTDYANTATFTTNSTGTTGSASQKVKVCVGVDLTVSKTATPSFTRTFKWGIQKSVDKTLVEQIGGTATFNYTVKVTPR